MAYIKTTLKSGLTLEGPLEDIIKACLALGEPLILGQDQIPKGYYLSSTEGLITIPDMDSNHIKNALCKRAAAFFEKLGKDFQVPKVDTQLHLSLFLRKFTELTKQQEIVDLFNELDKRSK